MPPLLDFPGLQFTLTVTSLNIFTISSVSITAVIVVIIFSLIHYHSISFGASVQNGLTVFIEYGHIESHFENGDLIMKNIFCAIVFFLFIASGCAPIISKEITKNVSDELTFKEIIKDPEAYRGKIVLISGVILGSRNTKEGTLIEILQRPAGMEGRPKDVDESGGRFLAIYDGYLDTAIYNRGREAVIAGEIKEKRTLPLGEIEYSYPLILIKEIHLFKSKSNERFHERPYPYWWYPHRGYYPYGYPW